MCGEAVEDALDVHVDHLIPLVHLQASGQRLRHPPGVVDHYVQADTRLDRSVHQGLLAILHIGLHGGGPAALTV